MNLDERNRMIQRLVDDIEEWSPDDLLCWAQEAMTTALSALAPEQLENLYKQNFGSMKNVSTN